MTLFLANAAAELAHEWHPDPAFHFWRVVIILAIVLLNAFFVAAEFAIVKVRDSQMQAAIDDGVRGAKFARQVTRNLDAYLSAVGQRTNEIMKQLTILSAMMLPLSFLSGFFGMNFEQLPFKSPVAFAACMVLMFVLVPGGMLIWFRRSGWL